MVKPKANPTIPIVGVLYSAKGFSQTAGLKSNMESYVKAIEDVYADEAVNSIKHFATIYPFYGTPVNTASVPPVIFGIVSATRTIAHPTTINYWIFI